MFLAQAAVLHLFYRNCPGQPNLYSMVVLYKHRAGTWRLMRVFVSMWLRISFSRTFAMNIQSGYDSAGISVNKTALFQELPSKLITWTAFSDYADIYTSTGMIFVF